MGGRKPYFDFSHFIFNPILESIKRLKVTRKVLSARRHAKHRAEAIERVAVAAAVAEVEHARVVRVVVVAPAVEERTGRVREARVVGTPRIITRLTR